MAKKTNLQDATFLIPVRLDSVLRLENLLAVVDFIVHYFDTHIHILEASGYQNHRLERLLPQEVSIRFIEDHDPVFHRTRYINQLVKECETPYLAVWDADVVVPPAQIIKSVHLLQTKKAHFVFPYKDKFLETSPILRELFLTTKDLGLLETNMGKMKELYLPNPVGGGFLANRSTYIDTGMENESFYGWGREDGDRINRWKILGYGYERVPGPLFHLTHDRGMNSTFHTPDQGRIKHSEILRIISMSKQELEEEVKNWYK